MDIDTTLPWVQTAMDSFVRELVETYRSEIIIPLPLPPSSNAVSVGCENAR